LSPRLPASPPPSDRRSCCGFSSTMQGILLPVRTSPLSLIAKWLEDLIGGFLLLAAASFTAARGSLPTAEGDEPRPIKAAPHVMRTANP
jgi:hypothetical protein